MLKSIQEPQNRNRNIRNCLFFMSKLERYLSNELYARLGHLSIKQNYRPNWMEGLELDVYIDELKIAIEVQGEQHHSFVEFFHKNQDGLESQKDRDAKKSLICREKGIRLVEIYTEQDADLLVKEIGGYKDQHPRSKDIVLEHDDYDVIQMKKKARRAVERSVKDRLHALAQVSRLIEQSVRHRFDITDKEVIEFYNKNKPEINSRIKASGKFEPWNDYEILET